MGDNLAELLYMAWRSERFAFEPDLPSWGNVRDPDVRAAWEAAATKARIEMRKHHAGVLDTASVEARASADPRLEVGLAFGARVLRGET